MTGKRVTTTLEEDLQALGISGMTGGNVDGIMNLTEDNEGVMPSLGASVHDVPTLFNESEENEFEDEDYEWQDPEEFGTVEEWREALGDDFDEILAEASKAKKGKKGKGKKGAMSSFVKELSKRKDVKDPEALAGWLAHYNPPNWEEVEEFRKAIGEDFHELIDEAKKAKKGGKKKMSALVKELSKRSDVKDPEALAGWLAHYNPPNWESEEVYRDVLGEDFEALLDEAKKAKKKKKMSALVKELSKRSDVKDPEALAGWLAHYNPPNWEDVEEDGEPIDEDHPIDGKYITTDLLERVKALPFDSMDEDTFTDVIEDLKKKSLKEDADDDLKALAEEVAFMLVEGRRRKRVRKAMSRGKATKMVCGEGKHWDESKKACVVAGGKYKSKRRKKQRKASRGPQKMKRERSQRKVKRMGLSASDQTFADKLETLISEDVETEDREYTVREEIIERIDRTLGLFAEEFDDERIDDVFIAVMEDVDEKADAGLLAEDEADEEQFLAAIAPALKLVRECYGKVTSEVVSEDDEDDEGDDDGAGDDDPLARLRDL